MSLVDDQQVKTFEGRSGRWAPGRVSRNIRSGQLPFQEVDASDEPGEVVPRVDMDASAAAGGPHDRGVDDAEVEPELVPHLLLPLDLERRRADDQDLPGPVTDDEFEGTIPASIVLPRPTSSATSRLTLGIWIARTTGSSW